MMELDEWVDSMRFCEKCSSFNKTFTIAPIQNWCDECTYDWEKIHSRSHNLTTEHAATVHESQEGRCAFCLDEVGPKSILPYGNKDYVYCTLCSSCFGRIKALGYSLENVLMMEYDIGMLKSITRQVTAKDRKWLDLCIENAKRFSTCAKAQHFAAIVGEDGILVGEGWNGVPSGEIHCASGGCQRAAEGVASNSSYANCTAQHAEINAIMRADRHEMGGSTMYISGTPCHECVRAIIHSGIVNVHFVWQKQYDPEWARATLGKHGVGVLVDAPLDDALAQQSDKLQKKYKRYTTTDLEYVKRMTAEIRLGMMMRRVAECLPER